MKKQKKHGFLSLCACLFLASSWVAHAAAGPEPLVNEAATPKTTQLTREIADFALATPVINTRPQPKYTRENIDYGMTAGMERSPGGRLWAAWFGGGDNAHAFVAVASSDDEGRTWSQPRVVIDPHDPALPYPRSCVVANLWTDPQGRLWLFFNQSMGHYDGRSGLWAAHTENPDAENPVWSEPVRIWDGVALQKPTVLSNGDWALPVVLWWKTALFADLDPFRGSNVFVSSDQGKTWQRRGMATFPHSDFQEPMIVERRDGSLWMTARTKKNIWESFSTDGGRTWSPAQFSGIANASSRHFIRRLSSGNLLLVKHGKIIDQTPQRKEGRKDTSRSELTAFLSDDDGKTWKGGLVLDERADISYPDGVQAPDGSIFISYDHDRGGEGDILMARFTEADILAGDFVSPQAKARQLIFKPTREAVKARHDREAKAKSNSKP